MRYKYTQDWKRQFISITIAMVYWYNSSIFTKTTRTYLKIPVFITNVDNDRIVLNADENGKLNQHTTLILKGNKEHLRAIDQDMLKIVINFHNKRTSYTPVRIKLDNILYNNQCIKDIKNLETIFFPEIIVKTTEKIRKEVRVQLLVPHLFRHKVCYILPETITQVIDGDKELIQKHEQHGLYWTLPDRVLQSKYNMTTEDNCIPLNIPPSEKAINIPSIKTGYQKISDPSINLLKVFFFTHKNHIERTFISVELEKETSKTFTIADNNKMLLKVKGVSKLFLESGQGHIGLQLSKTTSNNIEINLIFKNIHTWKKRYINAFLDKNSGLANNSRLNNVAKKYFAHYLGKVGIENRHEINSKISISGKNIIIAHT